MLGGLRPGSDWKCWTPGGVPPGSFTLGASSSSLLGGGSATLNFTSPEPFAPTRSGSAVTVTVSPGLNGLSGRKLAPQSLEYARSLPVWRPVSEPVTEMPVRSPGCAPWKLICVVGDAALLPSDG